MKATKLWLITIAALLCSLAASAHDFEVDGIYYNITSSTDLTVAVTFQGKYHYSNYEYTGIETIPENVTYNSNTYRVTSIGEYAFRGCSSLTSITIPENVTTIGFGAFIDCTGLTSITIPKGVTSIETRAFEYCNNLKQVFNYSNLSLTAGSSDYGEVAYYAKKVINKSKLTTIGDFQFYESSGILINYIGEDTELVLPSDCNGKNYKIGIGAFYGCSSLTAITIPKGVTSIGNYAFQGCTALQKVIIEDGSTTLSLGYNYHNTNGNGKNLFYDCPLEEVYLGRNLSYESNYQYGRPPFYGKTMLTALTIGSSVTSIGNFFFYGCRSLTSITIPESVTNIGEHVFEDCTALRKVIIEDGRTTLSLGSNSGQSLFCDCPLEEVYLGRNLSYRSESSYYSAPFYDKDKLTNVTIGSEVTEIKQNAFNDCDNIHSLTIGNGVLSIGNSAFKTPDKVIWLTNTPPTGYANAKGHINYVANNQYTGLKNVKVYPYLSSMFEVGGVKYVPTNPAERICNAIDCTYNNTATTINVGETASFKGVAMKVTEVMPYTFYGNKHIKEVSVSHLGNIGDHAFYDCDGIQSIELSNKGNIGSQAFYDCNGIKSLNISNEGYVGIETFRGCNALETAIIANSPKEKESITPTSQPIAFVDWTSTNQSNNSTSSKNYTFTAARGATLSFDWRVSSELGDKLIVILDGTIILEESGSESGTYHRAISQGEHILIVRYTKDHGDFNSSPSDHASVSYIVVSAVLDGVDGAVCNSAFYDCVSLKSVTLGDKATSLNNEVFRGCTSLEEIVIPNSVMSVGSSCFYGCTSMRNVMLGDGLTNIKEYTFANCGLEEIVIGDNITSIGDYAFKGCARMKNAVLGNGLTTVNGTMFSSCTGLEKVEIGNNVRELAANAFSGCSSLSTITIPQAVTTIGDNAFAGCRRLSDVIISDRTTALALGSNGSSALFADCPLDSVYIGGKITYNTTSDKGYSPFYRNTSLRSVVITNREEQIYANEFYGCTNLQNVTIGNGVKSIGNYAFSGCSSLEGFSFGSNMETIGAEAFSDCTSLTSITSHAAVPPICGTQALDDINKWGCTLRVPSGYASAYQGADQWKEFFFVDDVVEVAKYTLTFMVDGEVYHTSSLVHRTEVTIPDAPTKEGYTFSGWGKVPATMPAEDTTISGFFTPNTYKVYYYVDGKLVHTAKVTYGEAIPEYVYEPTIEGEAFVGWEGEAYETMPAHNLTYKTEIEIRFITLAIDQYGSGTFCSAHALDFSEVEGLKAYVATGYNTATGEVTLTRVMTAKPGEGLFLKGQPGDYEVPTLKSSESCMQNLLVGTLGKTIVKSTSDDGLSINYRYAVKGGYTTPLFYRIYGTTIEAGKAYLQLPKAWLGTGATRAAISLHFDDEEMEFGDEEQPADVAAPAVIYDLQGRRVANPTKGVFIVNGKKVVFK